MRCSAARNRKPDRHDPFCTGNICRSPAAEGVFSALVTARGLEGRVAVDSAGTGAWHLGEAPDARMREKGVRHLFPIFYDFNMLKTPGKF